MEETGVPGVCMIIPLNKQCSMGDDEIIDYLNKLEVLSVGIDCTESILVKFSKVRTPVAKKKFG